MVSRFYIFNCFCVYFNLTFDLFLIFHQFLHFPYVRAHWSRNLSVFFKHRNFKVNYWAIVFKKSNHLWGFLSQQLSVWLMSRLWLGFYFWRLFHYWLDRLSNWLGWLLETCKVRRDLAKCFKRRWSMLWLLGKHHFDKLRKLLWVHWRNRLWFLLCNAVSELHEVIALKWWLKTSKMVKRTSNSPYINFLVVLMVFDELWTEIQRCAYSRIMGKHSFNQVIWNAHVTKLDLFVLRHKDVKTLDVSVYDRLAVQVSQTRQYLTGESPQVFLRNVFLFISLFFEQFI